MSSPSAARPPLVVAAAQPWCTPFDLAANVAAHAEVVRAAQARIVVFPELSLTGYQLDAPAVDVDDPMLDELRRVCAATGSVVLLGAPVVVEAAQYIATLRVHSGGVDVVHRKVWLSDDEAVRFTSGSGPSVLELDGWRLGLATCKETGVDDYTRSLSRLGVDAYLAGVVHHADELDTQDARGRRVSRQLRVPVVLASAAGPVGQQYPETAGTSTIWSPSSWVMGRCDAEPGQWTGTMLPAVRPRECWSRVPAEEETVMAGGHERRCLSPIDYETLHPTTAPAA